MSITTQHTGVPITNVPSYTWAGNLTVVSAGTTAQQIFGSTDGPVVGGVPQVTPTAPEALYISSTGTQYQYFAGAWH